MQQASSAAASRFPKGTLTLAEDLGGFNSLTVYGAADLDLGSREGSQLANWTMPYRKRP